MIEITPLSRPVSQDVSLPGCIGYTIRALNIAAMTQGTVEILRPLKSDDTQTMLRALQTLGIEAEEKPDAFLIHGDVSDVKDGDYTVDVGLSGRSARSLLGLLCVVPGTKTVTCAEPFKKRPVGDLVEGLRQMGANITYMEKEGYLPVKIASHSLRPGTVSMSGELSSQYFSSIMMIAPLVGDVTIQVLGEQSSRPFIDMTMGIMKDFGVEVINDNYRSYKISDGQAYASNSMTYAVEPEATAASYFLAIAALTGSRIRILGLGPDSLQGDKYFADVLGQMGAQVKKDKLQQWIEVTGTDKLKGVSVDMNDTPDLVPTLAVVAAFADGKTVINNIAHARIKETDRIESPRQELAKMGIKTEATEGSLTIYGGKPHGAQIETYHDHRMAMAFAAAGTKIPGMEIQNEQVVSKSFPEFWEVLDSLQPKKNIVLIGMRGSGKSTVGEILAQRLGRQLINTDEMLEEKVGLSVSEVVARHGWNYFRDKESEVVGHLKDTQNAIISTGGGVILRQENIESLAEHGGFVYLDGSLDALVTRIQHEAGNRPALTDAKNMPEDMSRVLSDRQSIYQGLADIHIHTDDKSPEQIADEIIQTLEEKQ